jgi:hypothetical protein
MLASLASSLMLEVFHARSLPPNVCSVEKTCRQILLILCCSVPSAQLVLISVDSGTRGEWKLPIQKNEIRFTQPRYYQYLGAKFSTILQKSMVLCFPPIYQFVFEVFGTLNPSLARSTKEHSSARNDSVTLVCVLF